MSTTITKSEAAGILEDEIFALDEDFRKFQTNAKDGPESILWEYGRAGIFAEIMDDIVFSMFQTVEELKNFRKEKTQEGAAA